MKKIVILFFVILLNACNLVGNINERLVIKREIHSVSLVAVGDNLIHHTIYEAAIVDDNYDFKPFYQDIKPFIQKHDLAFINQETILGGKEIGLSSYPSFNSPFELGNAIIDAGFNLISIANNHTLDRGEMAIQNAISYLDDKNIIYSGATKDETMKQVKLFEVNKIRFAFVAWTTLTNGIKHPGGKTHLANVYSHQLATKTIEKIRNQVDFVIVSMHWG